MSSVSVVIVPLIAIGIIGAIVIVIAAIVAATKIKLIRDQDRLAGREYTEMAGYAQRADDLVCTIIGEIEKSPATAGTLLGDQVMQDIYSLHSHYAELDSTKGIR